MRKLCSALISRGHTNVFQYPYSFFKICCEQVREEFKYQTLAITTGLGLSLSGDKKAIEKFMDGK